MKQAEIEAGDVPGGTTDDARRITELEREVGTSTGECDSEVGVGFLRGGARPSVQQMITFIDVQKHEFGVEPVCRTLQVAPSSYYAAKTRPPSARSVSDTARTVEVERVHRTNYGVYGARKMQRNSTGKASRSPAARSNG